MREVAKVWNISKGGANDIAILKARYHRRQGTPIMDVHLVPRMNTSSARNRLECFSCHRMLPEAQFSIIDGSYNQCISYLIVSGYCRRCQKQIRNGADLSEMPPKLVTWLDKLYSAARSSRRGRGIFCGISKEDVYNLWIKQKGKCALTDVEMQYSGIGKNPLGASLDRIDSSLNYTPNNIQLVCWVVNQMKNNMTMEQFMLWVHRLAQHDDSVRNEA